MKKEIETLLGKKWELLLENCDKIKKGEYAGVYLLAYTDKNLSGKKVQLKDIFYVGMSNAKHGVKSRLKQFICGIEKGYGHSAGNRFYKDFCGGKSFSLCNFNKQFYVISQTFECNVHKDTRSPNDLRIMGKVCNLEYNLLAHIRENIGKEPELNKK